MRDNPRMKNHIYRVNGYDYNMKIALVEGPYLRPSGVLHWEELNNMPGYEVVAFNSNPEKYDPSSLDLEVRGLRWPEGLFTIGGYEHFFSRAIRKLRFPSDYLVGLSDLTSEFDVIHAAENYNMFSLQAALATRATPTKFTFSAGENIPYPRFQHNPALKFIKNFVNTQADRINTTTILGKRALIHEGTNHEKIDIIPNSINTSQFLPRSQVSPQQVELPNELADELNILFVHRLCEQKGTPYLIDAFQDLNESYDDINLILVGENHLASQYRDIISKSPDIYWLERVAYKNIKYIYNISDIFSLPSVTMTNNEEQFGVAVLEAMSSGLPTVVSDVGGLPHVVDESHTSIVVPERDVTNLKSGIERLIESQELRQELGREGRELVEATYDKEVVSRKLRAFYKTLDE